MDSQESQPVHPKGNQSWIFIGRTDAEAEAPTLWPPDAYNHLIGKDPHSGKDQGKKEKGTREDEMVGWHHRFNERELGQTLGDGEGQGSLACCSPWSHKESDKTWRLNNNNNSSHLCFVSGTSLVQIGGWLWDPPLLKGVLSWGREWLTKCGRTQEWPSFTEW